MTADRAPRTAPPLTPLLWTLEKRFMSTDDVGCLLLLLVVVERAPFDSRASKRTTGVKECNRNRTTRQRQRLAPTCLPASRVSSTRVAESNRSRARQDCSDKWRAGLTRPLAIAAIRGKLELAIWKINWRWISPQSSKGKQAD